MSAPDSSRPRGRKPVSTAEAVEQAAIELLLRRGYDAVSVDELAAAAGIGRTTFFRYFGSKAAVVCWGFDRAIDVLADALSKAADHEDTLAAVRAAVAASVRAGVDDRGVWWERFVLIDTVPTLRAEVAERWERWVTEVAGFVEARAGLPSGHPYARAIAAAHQGVYLATLRSWKGRPGNPEEMLSIMLGKLIVVGDAISAILPNKVADRLSSS